MQMSMLITSVQEGICRRLATKRRRSPRQLAAVFYTPGGLHDQGTSSGGNVALSSPINCWIYRHKRIVDLVALDQTPLQGAWGEEHKLITDRVVNSMCSSSNLGHDRMQKDSIYYIQYVFLK